MTVAFGADEIKPTSAAVLFLERKCMLDFSEFESRKLIVLIAATVVSAQYRQSFLISTSRDQPSCVGRISNTSNGARNQ